MTEFLEVEKGGTPSYGSRREDGRSTRSSEIPLCLVMGF